ncbi:hypothetical protein YC2023_018682 [Brassica napus]
MDDGLKYRVFSTRMNGLNSTQEKRIQHRTYTWQSSTKEMSSYISTFVMCLKSKHFTPQRSVMALEAWFMDDSNEDQRLPHHRNPKEFVTLDYLAGFFPNFSLEHLGVVHWKLNPENYENDSKLSKIREERGYDYMDLLDLCPEKVSNYEEKLKNFFTEHIHKDEEIRYCLKGSGYFDVRDKDDRWIRILMKPGDLIVLPAGIYHRFTLDTSNYIKLMRLFVGEPVWTPYNRPQEEHPVRKEYIKSLTKKFGETIRAY